MKVKIKGSDNLEIYTFDEFKRKIMDIINNVTFDNLDKLKVVTDFWLEFKDYEFTGIKKYRKMIKSIFWSNTQRNTMYWETRGYNKKEAKTKISSLQANSSAYFTKYKRDNPEKYKGILPTQLEYWLKYTNGDIEKANILLKERQTTFSKEICIKKLGEEAGLNRLKERNNKWISSLSNSDKFNYKKDSSSLAHFQNLDNLDNIEKAINKNFKYNKVLILDAINSSENIIEFIKYIKDYKNIHSLAEVQFIYSSIILQEYYNVSKLEIKKTIHEAYGIIPSRYGNIRYYNNHICRSNGEYYIAKFLFENNIEYEYEKKYPNSKYISDFYIPKYDLYVEYLGFLKSDYFKRINKTICLKYEAKYKIKEDQCKHNNLNYLFDNNYKSITNKILNYDK